MGCLCGKYSHVLSSSDTYENRQLPRVACHSKAYFQICCLSCSCAFDDWHRRRTSQGSVRHAISRPTMYHFDFGYRHFFESQQGLCLHVRLSEDNSRMEIWEPKGQVTVTFPVIEDMVKFMEYPDSLEIEVYEVQKKKYSWLGRQHREPAYRHDQPLVRHCIHSNSKLLTPRDIEKTPATVIGRRGDIAVIQRFYGFVNVDQFYVVDLAHGKLVGVLEIFDFPKGWYECLISPDGSQFLLNQPTVTGIGLLYHFKEASSSENGVFRTYERESYIAERESVYSFDNRYAKGFVWIGEEQKLIHWNTIKDEYASTDLDITLDCGDWIFNHIKCSPSGDFIALSCAKYDQTTHAYRRNCIFHKIVVLDTKHKAIIYVLSGFNHLSLPVSDLSVFPLFSACETFISIPGDESYHVTDWKLPVMDLSLRSACRKAITRSCHSIKTHLLPLPEELIRYVQFRRWESLQQD